MIRQRLWRFTPAAQPKVKGRIQPIKQTSCGHIASGWVYSIFLEYTDYESGGTSNRTKFMQMFEDARKRQFDLVLFWSLDRFSREGTRATINLLQQLEDCGVQFRSYTEQYLDSSGVFKDVIVSLLATLARQEKNSLR